MAKEVKIEVIVAENRKSFSVTFSHELEPEEGQELSYSYKIECTCGAADDGLSTAGTGAGPLKAKNYSVDSGVRKIEVRAKITLSTTNTGGLPFTTTAAVAEGHCAWEA